MEQDQLRVTIGLLLERRDCLKDLARVSQERENTLFQEWQNDPENAAKYQLWEQQKNMSKDAIEELERTQTDYLETCRKLSR
jgi:hypothetical protein